MTDVAESRDPAALGKPLRDEFFGYHRISFGRYRIIYQVKDGGLVVFVVMVGIRKQGDKIDIYEEMRRLHRRGEL